ncbi:MAG TPA: helix-turn-helix domain-containing protein, partial [Candidatus Paceibacterota bacterium]|nr:helix-turn-helix domain-containing protein [Candidatus Paceibacterota bacterium]
MDSLLDKNLITTREASELSGYHSDYLGRLCREGKISGSRVGRSWVIDRSSILRFVEEQELQKKKNAEELAHSREEEYKAVQAAKTPISAPVVVPTTPAVVRAVVPPAPAPVSIPSPYFSPKELQEKMVATLVAFLVITVGLYGSEAKFVERGARVAVETLENTSDIGTQAIASALKQGAVQLAAFRIGQEKFGMAFVSRVESGLVLYKGTITGAGEQLATDEVIAISSGAIDSLASQGSNGIVDTFIGSAVALGNTVVGASDAILNAHNNLATAWAEGSAAVPPRLITAFYGAGTEAIALVSNVPSAIALGYENATYAWVASTQDLAMRITRAELSVGTVALERTNDVVIALTTPEVPSDGARGALAELFETRLTTPSTPTRSLAAASAATDFFAPARSLALFTYETINGFFSRTGAVLAGMFAPNIAYAPEVSTIPTPLTVTSVTNIATSSSYITYITNPVSYIYSGTGGASIAYVQKAMDNLRRDLADRDDNNNSGGGLADITGSSIEELSDVATMTKSFGDVFLWNGTEWTNVATSSLGIGAGTGAPGGASGQVQYNNAGVFAGDAGFTYDVGAGRLTATYASTTGISTAYASSTLLRAGTAIIDSLSATLATLTGLIATDATTTNATSTNLAVMNSFALGADRFTDLTGPGLTASSGTLAVDDVTPAMLQAADFGAFTCNGTSCALDAASISDTHINFGSVTLADFTNDAGFITSAITSVGPTGQMQTGSAITLATTSTAFNGLTASTTITASGNIITFANTLSGRLGVAGGGTGTTTAPTYGQLLVGDGSGGYALLATSSLGISGGTPGGANGQVQFNNAGAFGGSAAFTFDSTAGRLSASYASTTGFSSVYASSTNLFAGNLTLGALSGILKASGGVVSVATAGVDYLTSAITSIGPAGALQTGAAITLATSTAGTDFTITAAGNTLTFNLPSASATNRGVLSSADWSVFNNKISSTSLSASAPLSYNPSTGSFTITQATTGTNGYVSAADFTTFNNKISSTSLSAGAGISYVPATGVITNTGVLTTSGDWTGTFDGQQGTYYLDRTNHTGTQLASTISDFASVARSLFSSSATGLTYTAGTGAFSLTSGYVIPLVASTTQWDTAFSWGNHATAGYENALSFIYPLVRTVDAISLAFGTTTANTWGAQQTFTGIFATNASSTNATTTNLTVNGAFRGAGLTSCSASGDKLLWNSTTGQFTCGADAGAGGGITAIGAQYSTFQTGSSQTFATSSDTNLGLIITSAGDTHTFMPTWIGTLASGRLNSNVVQGVTNDTNVTGSISAQNLTLGWTGLLSVARGGTGWGNLQANTVLLGNGTGAISTTSAGSNGQVLALVGGVPTWVATSSINNGVASIQQTGGGVAQTGAITFATSSATNNGVTIGLNITNTGGAFTFTPSRSGTLTVAGGGTGVGTFTSGQLLYGNGTNALSSVATTTFTPSGEFTTTGTIGALIGGSNSTISLATNGVALTKLAQIAANTILGNATGATGNVTAIATSTLFGTG